MDVNIGGWSLDQLMELAGLSVSQAGRFKQLSPRAISSGCDTDTVIQFGECTL